MQPPELEQAITKAVSITSQKVLVAKRFLMSEGRQSQLPDQLLQLFLVRMEAPLPKEITINASTDFEAVVKSVSESLSWHVAFEEALWQLMNAGFFLAAGGAPQSHDPHAGYFQGQGGQRLQERIFVRAVQDLATSADPHHARDR